RAAIDIENVMLAAVGMEMRRQNSALHRAALGYRVQEQRTGPVAEQHAGAAVLPIEDARECLGPDDERRAGLAEAQRVVGNRQRKDETGAHRLHIESSAARHSEARLNLDRSRWEG